MQIKPNKMVVDLIGKFFIIPPCEFHTKKKDVRVDTEHPLLRVLQLPMRLQHIHQFHGVRFVDRANLMCNGT